MSVAAYPRSWPAVVHFTLSYRADASYGDREIVDKKWQELLTYEAEIMKDLGKSQMIHG